MERRPVVILLALLVLLTAAALPACLRADAGEPAPPRGPGLIGRIAHELPLDGGVEAGPDGA